MKKVDLDSCKKKEKKHLNSSCAMYHILKNKCLVDGEKCPVLKTIYG